MPSFGKRGEDVAHGVNCSRDPVWRVCVLLTHLLVLIIWVVVGLRAVIAVTIAGTFVPTHGRMARLSCIEWLVKYQDAIAVNGHPPQY